MLDRLLREERLRKVIRKDLPKLTKYLEKHIKMWEQKHAMQFVWKGERVGILVIVGLLPS